MSGPAFILHTIGQDTFAVYDWNDDDDADITVSEATFTITAANGDDIAAATVTINDTDAAVTVHLADDADITAGVYSYECRAVDAATGDATILDTGVLRVTGA